MTVGWGEEGERGKKKKKGNEVRERCRKKVECVRVRVYRGWVEG